MKLVTLLVETRPQYGTGATIVVGIFDDEKAKQKAIKKASAKWTQYQQIVQEHDIVLNELFTGD